MKGAFLWRKFADAFFKASLQMSALDAASPPVIPKYMRWWLSCFRETFSQRAEIINSTFRVVVSSELVLSERGSGIRMLAEGWPKRAPRVRGGICGLVRTFRLGRSHWE